MGGWGQSPQEKGGAEKPQALKRGGRLSPLLCFLDSVKKKLCYNDVFFKPMNMNE
jgi:hypothetical protein